MTAPRLTFPGAMGQPLAARLEMPPDTRPRAYALFAHCFTCSKDIKAAVHIARELTRYGIAVLRFDFTGLGESAGDFADTSFSSNIDDLVAACGFLTKEYAPPSVLIGHSLGGAAVLHAAAQLPEVRAVATIGAPFDPAHVKHLFVHSEEEIREAGHATVSIGGRPFMVRSAFLDDLEGARSERVIADLKRALLVMHSPVDTTVGIENAARIYEAAKHPKSFISLDTADHLLTRERDACYAAVVLGAWVSRYVPPVPSPSVESLRGEHRAAADQEKRQGAR